MSIHKALKILNRNGIQFKDYFDLIGVETMDVVIKNAIERVKTYIVHGK